MKKIKPGATANGAPVAPAAGGKKKRLILAGGVVAIVVIGVVVLKHRAPPSAPAPITVDTVPAHERVALAHPSSIRAGVAPALHPAVAASAATMVNVTPASTGSAVTVFPPLAHGFVGTPQQPSFVAPAAQTASMPNRAETQAERYGASMYFSQESALQRKLRILELKKKIASTQHDIDKLKNASSDADGSVVLPPPVAIMPPTMASGAKPVSTLTIKSAASTAAALAVPNGVGDGSGSSGPSIVSIMGVGGSYEAVVRVNGFDYAVRQGQMAGSWMVSRITSNAVDLSHAHQAMRLSF